LDNIRLLAYYSYEYKAMFSRSQADHIQMIINTSLHIR